MLTTGNCSLKEREVQTDGSFVLYGALFCTVSKPYTVCIASVRNMSKFRFQHVDNQCDYILAQLSLLDKAWTES